MAPEVLCCPLKRHPGENKDRADLYYSQAVDAWAVGVLAYELLTGRWVGGGGIVVTACRNAVPICTLCMGCGSAGCFLEAGAPPW